MRILVTNDDGIASPHLKTLANLLSKDHEVWVVAPDVERSACSHSITIQGPLGIKEVAEQWYACSGTPADCVLVALKGFVPYPMDCVISGINLGPNVGTDILYSGTAAGARQGAIMGRPSMSVSVNSKDASLDISYHAGFIQQNLTKLQTHYKPGYFFNINFPKICTENTGIAFTFPGKRIYTDELTTFSAPDGKTYCFLKGEPESAVQKGSDSYAIESGKISISRIKIGPAYADIDDLLF